MFQAIFGIVDKFGWWYIERIKTDTGMQFTYREFQEGLTVLGVQPALAEPDHQETNGQVKVTWWTLLTITHSIMVHALVSDRYIYIALMDMTDHISTVLPIKYLVNQDGEPIIPCKLATGTNIQYQNHVFYSVYVLYKRQMHMLT